MSRKVRVVSLCAAPGIPENPEDVFPLPTGELLAAMEESAAGGADLILTPEIWNNETAEPAGNGYTSPSLNRAAEIAAKYRTYIAVCMGRYLTAAEELRVRIRDTEGIWKKAGRLKHNSCFLLDRNGKQVYIYDKLYPYPPEFQKADGAVCSMRELTEALVQETPAVPGGHLGIYDCDFGRVGFAICFDMNFPDLWGKLAEAGAELVIWPAAFSGGRGACVRAAANHYYVVTCTCIGKGDCRVADISGDELLRQYPEPGKPINTAKITLDLDRIIFHKNFNEGPIARIEKERPGLLTVDKTFYGEEEWIILSTPDGKETVEELCQKYGLVPLRAFQTNIMEAYVDRMRGTKLW